MIPINVLHRNSSFFRYFYQYDTRNSPMAKGLFRTVTPPMHGSQMYYPLTEPLPEEFVSFAVSSRSTGGRLCLLKAFQSTFESFAGSLKTLRIKGFYLVSELVSLLNHFSNFERFPMGNDPRPFSYICLGDMTRMLEVRIQTLKELTIDEYITGKGSAMRRV
ncbi:hypothetical protein MVEG_08243 [Podila verticillata NRRL 6337]|nr:hypothetical protein MVEG_08243 [Podila verticillata NRRL 6337]